MSKTKKQLKRGRAESDSETELNQREELMSKEVQEAWPRFLIVEGIDEKKPLSKLSPFAVAKGFEGISPRLSVKRLRDGSLLVECSSEKDSKALMSRDGTEFVDRKVKVSVHRALNSSKGVIRCPHLEGMSESDILSELSEQGVREVKRVFVTKGPSKVPTNTLFLTFAMAKLPESIRVGYLRVKVTHFIPSPLRCFRCQKYGHSSKFCRSEEICRDCGKAKHEGEGCKDPKCCVNCEGKHSSSSQDCPKWKLEREYQRVKTVERCSFVEARKKVMATVPNLPNTYAKAASTATGAPEISSEKESPAQTRLASSIESLLVALTAAVKALTARIESLEQAVASSQTKKTVIEVPGAAFKVPTPGSTALKNVRKGEPTQALPGISQTHTSEGHVRVAPSPGGKTRGGGRPSVPPKPGAQTDRRSSSTPRTADRPSPSSSPNRKVRVEGMELDEGSVKRAWEQIQSSKE